MKQNVGFTKGRTAEHARPRVTSPSCGRRRRRLGSGAKRPRRCRCNAPAKSRPPLRQAYVSRGPLLQMARRRLHPSWPRITLTPDSSVPSQHTPSSTTDLPATSAHAVRHLRHIHVLPTHGFDIVVPPPCDVQAILTDHRSQPAVRLQQPVWSRICPPRSKLPDDPNDEPARSGRHDGDGGQRGLLRPGETT